MNSNNPFQPQALLWWIAIISLGIAAAVYVLLAPQAEVQVEAQKLRMGISLIAVVVAGVCLIWGTAGRWFK